MSLVDGPMRVGAVSAPCSGSRGVPGLDVASPAHRLAPARLPNLRACRPWRSSQPAAQPPALPACRPCCRSCPR